MKPLVAGEPVWIGRYRLLAQLGQGGMGRVLLALSPDGRLAALKQIHPHLTNNPNFRTRFTHEITASRHVSGAHTAPILDADPNAPTPWLATLYIPGPNLNNTITTHGPLPTPALHHLTAGLTTALTDIHNTGLIHRDLKPSNILLTTDGPRVIDFGIARAVDDDPDRTHTGELVGSPGFMSPEQAEGKPLTAASDVFALGSLLAMAATGRAPFDGVTAPQTLYNILYTEPDTSGIPSPLREIIAACLAKDPAQRPTPQQILDHIGPPPPTSQPWPAPIHEQITKLAAKAHAAARTPPKRSRLKVAGAALAAAAVGGGAVLSVMLIGLTDQQKGTASAAAAPPSSETTVDDDPLSANRLRAVDPCAVFDDGVEPVIGVHFNMCTYTDPDGHWLELKIGTHVPSDAVPSDEIAGLAVGVDEFGSRGHCRATAILPEDPANGITVQAGPGTSETPKDDYCDSAKEGLGDAIERITSGTANRTDGEDSLATVDPCTLIEAAELQRVFSIAPTTEKEGLHGCSWQVNGKIKLDLENAVPPGTTESEKPIKLGDIDAFEQAQPADGSPSCTVSWSHRESGKTFDEVVRLRYLATGTGLPVEEVCGKVREAAASIIPRLPQS